jgi:hypothetical protein
MIVIDKIYQQYILYVILIKKNFTSMEAILY